MEKMNETAPTKAIASILEDSREAKTEIPDNDCAS
jgi:hypothetical protein